MTKQEILDEFDDIDSVYNDSSKHETLSKMLDELLDEQEERKGNYVPCKVKTPTGKWNGEKCSVCGTEYIGSAPLKWKFCPDCGAKMEGR